MGLDSRALTPLLAQRIVYAAAETRSFARAAVVLREVGGNTVSAKTIQPLTQTVGSELAALGDEEEEFGRGGLSTASEAPPELAVVQCDGGRIRTRAEGCGAGVHRQQWRETKNACLLRMTLQRFADDPHPALPRAFRDPQKAAKLESVPKSLGSGGCSKTRGVQRPGGLLARLASLLTLHVQCYP